MRAVPVALLVLALGSPAHAEPPGLTIATPLTAAPLTATTIGPVDAVLETAPKVETRSYRWQIALTDFGALIGGALGSSITGNEDTGAGIFAGSYLLGAPMVHAANGHGWRAIGSLGLRIALPALGAALGVRIQGREECLDTCIDTAPPTVGLVFGIGIGGLTAIVLDQLLLAKPEKVARGGWLPTAVPIRGGAVVGLAARF